jgi:hypothetical protein
MGIPGGIGIGIGMLPPFPIAIVEAIDVSADVVLPVSGPIPGIDGMVPLAFASCA